MRVRTDKLAILGVSEFGKNHWLQLFSFRYRPAFFRLPLLWLHTRSHYETLKKTVQRTAFFSSIFLWSLAVAGPSKDSQQEQEDVQEVQIERKGSYDAHLGEGILVHG